MLGIGGNTIDDAKRSLSFEEFLEWVAYRNKYGTLSIFRQINMSIALGIVRMLQLHGNKPEFFDHMVFEKDPEKDREISFDEFIMMMNK